MTLRDLLLDDFVHLTRDRDAVIVVVLSHFRYKFVVVICSDGVIVTIVEPSTGRNLFARYDVNHGRIGLSVVQ